MVAPDYFNLRLSGCQRSLVGEALGTFARRSTHALTHGKVSRPLPPPVLDGNILMVPIDPESIKMFTVSVRILILGEHTNGATQAVEGLITRMNRAAAEAGMVICQ